MSRRSVTRAVCAPLAIALVTTAIPPTISNSSAINYWAGKALSATLTSSEAGMSRLGDDFNRYAQQGAGKVVQMREGVAAQVSVAADAVASSTYAAADAVASRMSAAVDAVASGTSAATDAVASGANATLARVDIWMTSVSQSVIAMLPSASVEQEPTTIRPIEVRMSASDALQQTASLPAVSTAPSVSLPTTIEIAPTVNAMPVDEMPAPMIAAALESPAPQVLYQEPAPEIEKASAPAPVEKMVLAALAPAQTATSAPAPAAAAAEAKIEATPAPVTESEIISVAKPAPEILAEAAPAAKVVAEDKPQAMTETKIEIEALVHAIESNAQEPKAEEKLVVASLGHQIGTTDAQAIAAPMHAIELKVQESKADEKLVVSSIGQQDKAVDAPAPEFKALPSLSEPDVSPNGHVIDPIQMTNMPMSSPLKIRALTRADIPSAEKVASLGPSSASSNLPAEQQRVAYDAPLPVDEPMSIGRRRWTEEAAKYQGLGSPEALLEALKHMGAGAKTLGLPASLWCADFMNLVLRKSGIPATGSRAAKSYLQYGKKIDEPRVGAIAIFSRGKNGGHIGIVRGTDGKGNPIIVSGNHNHKVAEAIYPKERVIAYVVPR